MINFIGKTDNYYTSVGKNHRVFEVLDAITAYEVTITFKNSIPAYIGSESSTFNFEPLEGVESYKQIKVFIIGDSITFSGKFAGGTPYTDAFYGQEDFNLDKFTIQSSSPFYGLFSLEEATDNNNKKHIFFRSSIRDTYATYRVFCHNNSLVNGIENNSNVNYDFNNDDYTMVRAKNAVYTQIDSANNFSPKLKISVNKPVLIIRITNNDSVGLLHLSGLYNYIKCGLMDIYIRVNAKISDISIIYGNNIFPVSIKAYKYIRNNLKTADIVLRGTPFSYSKCCSLEYNVEFNYLSIANEDSYTIQEGAEEMTLNIFKNGGRSEEKPNIDTNFNNISYYYDTTVKKLLVFNGSNWKSFDGHDAYAKRSGFTEERPTNLPKLEGFQYFDISINKPIWWTGLKWVDSEGNTVENLNKSGTFAEKPDGEKVRLGYNYFCTDRKTTEGNTNGIMIYYKGNNVWVDALGRVVS